MGCLWPKCRQALFSSFAITVLSTSAGGTLYKAPTHSHPESGGPRRCSSAGEEGRARQCVENTAANDTMSSLCSLEMQYEGALPANSCFRTNQGDILHDSAPKFGRTLAGVFRRLWVRLANATEKSDGAIMLIRNKCIASASYLVLGTSPPCCVTTLCRVNPC